MTLGYDYAFKRFQCRQCRSDVTGFLMARRALEACEDYFDQRTVAEMLPDGPSANEEGQLLVEVGEALHQIRSAGDCPMCRYLASADTHPKGQGLLGLAGTESGAVPSETSADAHTLSPQGGTK
jgi:hypothetical protein